MMLACLREKLKSELDFSVDNRLAEWKNSKMNIRRPLLTYRDATQGYPKRSFLKSQSYATTHNVIWYGARDNATKAKSTLAVMGAETKHKHVHIKQSQFLTKDNEIVPILPAVREERKRVISSAVKLNPLLALQIHPGGLNGSSPSDTNEWRRRQENQSDKSSNDASEERTLKPKLGITPIQINSILKLRKGLNAKSKDESSVKSSPEPRRKYSLRVLGRLTLLLQRALKFHSLRVQDVLSTFESLNSIVEEEEVEIIFDKTAYKAKKVVQLTTEAKRILQKIPENRSTRELFHLRMSLSNYDVLREYPIHMLKMVSERAWYETYTSKRVIIREGHRPDEFYFILVGAVVLSQFDRTDEVSRPIGQLSKSDSLGDLDLINNTPRQVTVIAKNKVELLCLHKKDFIEIFMSSVLGNPQDPFLKCVPCLEHWPVALLRHNPTKTRFAYFKRGTVLTSDSLNSEWLYIIKSGSCRVMKKVLYVVRPRKVKRKRSNFNADLSHEFRIQRLLQVQLQKSLSVEKWEQQKKKDMPDINIQMANPKEELSRLIQTSQYLRQPSNCRATTMSRESSFLTNGGKSPRVPFLCATPYISRTPKSKDLIGLDRNHLKTSTKNEPEPKRLSRFVILQVLTSGASFGMADMLFASQPSLSLVSSGAEVIMIKKRFYLENAPPWFISKLRDTTRPYPPESILEDALQNEMIWMADRKQEIARTLMKLHLKKVNLHDSRSKLDRIVMPTYYS